jgi:hypothetical protein
MRRRPRLGGFVVISALFLLVSSTFPAKVKDSDNGNNQVKMTSKTHVRLGGITVEGGYAHYSGPHYYSPYYFPAYSPYWLPSAYYWSPWYDLYSPYYNPGVYRSYSQGPGMGEVKLLSVQKEAEVYLNGAYAGVVEDLKTLWLEPGAYDLEVQGSGNLTFKKRIYVLSGKSLKITPVLEAKNEEVKP